MINSNTPQSIRTESEEVIDLGQPVNADMIGFAMRRLVRATIKDQYKERKVLGEVVDLFRFKDKFHLRIQTRTKVYDFAAPATDNFDNNIIFYQTSWLPVRMGDYNEVKLA